MCFWWVFVMILVILYIASMTNLLRVGPTQDAFHPLADIRVSVHTLVQINHTSRSIVWGASPSVIWIPGYLSLLIKHDSCVSVYSHFLKPPKVPAS